jgi:putative oxidoreductase
LAVGLLMMGHGAQKLFGAFGGHGPSGTGQFSESLGLRPGRQMAIAAGATELTGGALLALGFLTPLAAALISAVLLTAAFTAHRGAGLWVSEGGYEYNLVLVAGLFALTAVGPGEWSLDNAIGTDADGAGWAFAELAAAGLGAAAAIIAGRSLFGARAGGLAPAEPSAEGASGGTLEPSAPAGTTAGPVTATPVAPPADPVAAAFVVRLRARPGREAEAVRLLEQDLYLDRDLFPRRGGRRVRHADLIAAAFSGNRETVFAEPRIERE